MTSRPSLLRTSLSVALLGCALAPFTGCRATKNLLTKLHHRRSKSKANSTDFADNVQQVLSTPTLGMMKWSNFSDYQGEAQSFYDGRNFELAWTRDGKPTEQATRLIQLFGDAAKKGLSPEDYDSSRWADRVAKLASLAKAHDTSDSAQDTIAQFDAALTISAMRYLCDLHLGRINPQSLNFDIDVPAKRAAFDVATLLDDQIVDADDVTAVIDPVEPQNPMYKATEAALPKYLELAKAQATQPPDTLPPVAKSVAVGGQYPALAALIARLQLEGDAPAGPATSNSYDQGVSQAVQHFQTRYGLSADGKLSQGTLDAMNVPMSQRVQQFNLSLERWRWLPDNYVQPRVLVNLPEYIVRTYETDHSLAFKMKVVDGESNGHDTPMFVRTMKFLIFRPYWNLPVSIVKKEIMRHVNASGIGYLAAHEYEVVGASGQPVSDVTAADLEHSRYLVRQKPGPKNSLGLVKFMFPNEYDIYMHSTPEMNLFNLTNRDRSHGCVRLQDAEKMANWVLTGQPNWDADKIHQAMYGEPLDKADSEGNDTADDQTGANATSGPTEIKNNKQVNLQTQLPVVLTYLTANADEDGTVHFFNDVYGYDKQLEEALAKPRPYPKDTVKINPKLVAGETE